MVLIACKKAKSREELIASLSGNRNPMLDHVVGDVTSNVHEFNSSGGVLFTDDKSNIEELTFRGQMRMSSHGR
jgi:hypothetical protein